MRVSGLKEQQINAWELAPKQSKGAVQLIDDRRALADALGLNNSFAELAEDVKELRDPGNFSSSAAYSEAVKKLAAEFNRVLGLAKDAGSPEGQQTLRLLRKISDQLAMVSADTGLKVKNGGLEFDSSIELSTDWAAVAFKTSSDKIAEAQPGIKKALEASAARYQASIDQHTRSQLFLSEATNRLSVTYDSRGSASRFSGFTSIYQLS